MFDERLLEIASACPLCDVFDKTKILISEQTPETRKSLLENENTMTLLAIIIQGYDGEIRAQKAQELANSFGDDNFQNLEAYDFLSKTLGLKASIQ